MSSAVLHKTTVVYRRLEGHEIRADVYRPMGDDLCPVIVNIHGGALIMGSREELDPEILLLAEEHGYAVVSIDYRLAPETKLPGIVEDVEAAITWIGGDGAEQFQIDPDRMIVVGGSAGGYLALVAGYRAVPRPKALVVLYGYGQLTAEWFATPSPYPGHNSTVITREVAEAASNGAPISDGSEGSENRNQIYRYYRQTGLWPEEVGGFDRASIADAIAPYEPTKHVTRDFPPTLLVHGVLDTDVPIEESVTLAERFADHGVPHIFRAIDKGEHMFDGGDQAQIDAANKTIKEFALRHLGPSTSPQR